MGNLNLHAPQHFQSEKFCTVLLNLIETLRILLPSPLFLPSSPGWLKLRDEEPESTCIITRQSEKLCTVSLKLVGTLHTLRPSLSLLPSPSNGSKLRNGEAEPTCIITRQSEKLCTVSLKVIETLHALSPLFPQWLKHLDCSYTFPPFFLPSPPKSAPHWAQLQNLGS